MEPQKILIHSSQRGKGLFEQADHSDKGIKIGDIPTLVIVWEKSAVPKPMIPFNAVVVIFYFSFLTQ